ncbi:UbiA family prenyltransferase [bacterium]|nr:UbiA family prenyltransferase [bacterium]
MTAQPLKSIAGVIRADNWFCWKIPPLFAVAYASFLLHGTDYRLALQDLLLILWCIASVASYGHIINDIFDIEADRAGGKPNAMERFRPWQHLTLSILSVLSGLGALLCFTTNWMAAAALMINYLLPTIYSIPPLRLKERGVAGVACDALGAHAVPVLFVLLIVGFFQQASTLAEFGIGISAIVWSLFAGFRSIVVHQVDDLLSDGRSDIVTFAGTQTRASLRRLVLWFFLPVEAIALGTFIVLLLPFSYVLAIATLAYAVLETGKLWAGMKMPIFFEESEAQERYLPLLNNSFYELWLPNALLLQLCAMQTEYLIIGLLHLLLFGAQIFHRGYLLLKMLRKFFFLTLSGLSR